MLVATRSQFFFWASSSIHCLAALDFGAGVEQTFDCLIDQNRQAVQSMRRAVDWTLEDSMVDDLFFFATFTGRRGGHTPFVPAGVETGAEVVKPDLLERAIPGWYVPVSGIKIRNLVGLSAHSPFHWWSAHCAARVLLLSDKLVSCCAAGTNGCLDLRCRASAVVGQVSTERSRCPGSRARRPRKVWLHCNGAQQVGCLRGLEGCLLV